jgi:iron complex transport system permease protein
MNTSRFAEWGMFLFSAILMLLIAILISLRVGEVQIRFIDLAEIWTDKESMEYAILTKLRIPRTLLAFSVGGALSLTGTILQAIYRNPLVEPYTLGISGGAALGISICIVFGLQSVLQGLTLTVFGFVGSLITLSVVYLFSSSSLRGFDVNRMLLTGVMISFIASSGMMFLMAITTADNMHDIIFWTMGSLNEPNSTLIKISVITSLAGLVISYLFVTPLNALILGETKAGHLGINTGVTIKVLFVVASLITGISVAVAGVIGFVGLVIPHIARFMAGSDNRILLPFAFLGGSIFLILSDVIARVIIAPSELPVGVITGIIGGIVFLIALRSKRKKLIE